MQFYHFTPALTQLILDQGKSSLGDLLKLTCSDLVLKQVLKIEYGELKETRNKNQKQIILLKGKNFETYTYKPHEILILRPFIKNADLKITLKRFIRDTYKATFANANYKTSCIQQPLLQPYFKSNLFLRFLNQYPLTKKGKELRHSIQLYLDNIYLGIQHHLKNNPAIALIDLLELGGHILLLKDFNPKLIEHLHFDLLKSFSKKDLQDLDPFYYPVNPLKQDISLSLLLTDIYKLQSIFDAESRLYGHASKNNASATYMAEW